MVRAWVSVVAACVCVVLAGCGGGGMAPDVAALKSVAPANLKASGKAVIVFSSSYSITGILGDLDNPMQLSFGRPGSTALDALQNGVSSGSDDRRERPSIKQVDAGPLDLVSFTQMVGGKIYLTNKSAMLGVPLASLTVSPGDVVYVGHVLVVGEDRAMGIGEAKSFSLKIQDDSAKARDYLQTVSPALAQQLTVRFMTVNPIYVAKP